MAESLQVYRDAIAERVHAVCLDRNLDPQSTTNTEAACRIEQFLPQLVELAKTAGPDDPGAFQAAFENTICAQCGNLDDWGMCRAREQAACCLYRYLPLIYEAIHSAHPARS